MILGHKMKPNEAGHKNDPRRVPMKLENGFFEQIKNFPNYFSPEVLAEVGRKSIDLSRPSKNQELE